MIGQTEDDDEGGLRTYEVYNNDEEDDVDYDEESDGVQNDFESDEGEKMKLMILEYMERASVFVCNYLFSLK